MRRDGVVADIIIIAVLAVIVFFIARSQLGRLRKGRCIGSCEGCSAGCCGCCEAPVKKAGN